MVPLSAQLGHPSLIGALLLYAVLIAAPVVALRRASRAQRWLAIGFAAAAVAVRLVRFDSTPPGVNPDDVDALRTLGDEMEWG